MQLITFPLAPNGKRVEMFIAEKTNAKIETTNIGMDKASLEKIKHLNPLKQVPILKLEDGKALCESTAICRYIESQFPDNNLLGNSAFEEATIEMWQRRMELGFFIPIVEFGHHTHPFFKDSIKQIPEFGPFHKNKVLATIELLNDVLAKQHYIAGDRFTIADITAYCGLQLAAIFEMITLEDSPFKQWSKLIDQRQSAKYAQYAM